MLKFANLTGYIFFFTFLLINLVWSVPRFKVSNYGSGTQIWFEAEDFDNRSESKNYRLGKKEKAIKPLDGSFGDIITNQGIKGWIMYRFDISQIGGEAGKWRLSYRQVNPNNHSDWLWVLGDDGDQIPIEPPIFVRPDHIIGEVTVPHPFKWIRIGDGTAADEKGKDAATVNTLKSGENVMMLWTRQGSLEVQYDVFCWSSDLKYEATDEDYKKAKDHQLAIESKTKLTVIWAKLRRSAFK